MASVGKSHTLVSSPTRVQATGGQWVSTPFEGKWFQWYNVESAVPEVGAGDFFAEPSIGDIVAVYDEWPFTFNGYIWYEPDTVAQGPWYVSSTRNIVDGDYTNDPYYEVTSVGAREEGRVEDPLNPGTFEIYGVFPIEGKRWRFR